MEGYGQLVFDSGRSSIENYECGCDELKTLYEILRDTRGVYGGRFSGAGFKGCCMALIDPELAEEIGAKVSAAYLIRGLRGSMDTICARARTALCCERSAV